VERGTISDPFTPGEKKGKVVSWAFFDLHFSRSQSSIRKQLLLEIKARLELIFGGRYCTRLYFNRGIVFCFFVIDCFYFPFQINPS
jgi:hypothetical protein